MKANTPEDFWKHVNTGAPNACWPCDTAQNADGYCRCRYNGARWSAHRLAYSLHHGTIPVGQEIRHTCDNPPCCNPAHLVPGTHVENMQDRSDRHRQAAGERNGRAKLTAETVCLLRSKYTGSRGEIGRLAREFGINQGIATDILKGKTWRHLLPAEAPRIALEVTIAPANLNGREA